MASVVAYGGRHLRCPTSRENSAAELAFEAAATAAAAAACSPLECCVPPVPPVPPPLLAPRRSARTRGRRCLAPGAYTRLHFSSTWAFQSTVLPNLTHECVLELFKLSSNVNDFKPLPGARHGRGAARQRQQRVADQCGLHAPRVHRRRRGRRRRVPPAASYSGRLGFRVEGLGFRVWGLGLAYHASQVTGCGCHLTQETMDDNPFYNARHGA